MYVCMYVCTYVMMSVCMHVFTYVCMHVCVCAPSKLNSYVAGQGTNARGFMLCCIGTCII